MAGTRQRGETIRQFIVNHVAQHGTDIAAFTAQTFGISRQAANKHLKRLVEQGDLQATGTGSKRSYALPIGLQWEQTYPLQPLLSEDIIWTREVKPLLIGLFPNAVEIWFYGFTEMLNNAIDHSAGTIVKIKVLQTVTTTEITIQDDGEGIFRKIQREMNLLDERHAVLELAKGKLTTDPDHHSGQGIFFSSRLFDQFAVVSGNVTFSHQINFIEDWILEHPQNQLGTTVLMRLENQTQRDCKTVFDQFSATLDEGYGFIKTVVPVRLAQYGDEQLVSRSQAKRLLARVDKFKVVIFDFSEVEAIGQAFADEVFRVFPNRHPDLELMSINTNLAVQSMIQRASTS